MKKKIIFIIITILLILLVVTAVAINVLRNKMTPEETLSKFMYLIENKEYEKAKKLCSSDLEKLDILSNIKPTNFSFDFSEDKKEAEATILENEETLEISKMYVYLDKSILGWKINKYKVETNLISGETIQKRLDNNEQVSDLYLLHWAMQDTTSAEDISKYAKDNTMVALIFAENMKNKQYNKANEMYKPTGEESLTIEKLKDYTWNDYEIVNNFKMVEGPKGDLTCVTIKTENKKLWLYVAGKSIIVVKEATV